MSIAKTILLLALLASACHSAESRQFWPQPNYSGPRSCTIPRDVRRIESANGIRFYLGKTELWPGAWIATHKGKTSIVNPPKSGPVMNFERIEIREEP